MKRTLLLIGIIVFSVGVFANSNPEAKQLFENSKQKLSLKNVHLILDLETFDRKGNSKSKVLAVSYAEFGQLKKVMIDFIAPENVTGTKILTTDYPNKKSIIEIYMPSTGRIQKIRASQTNFKIMGSEIPITQFSTNINAEFDFAHLGNEVINGKNCHKIKIQKSNERGDYGIAFISIDKENLLKVETYNMQNKLVTLTELSNYKRIDKLSNNEYPNKIMVKNFKSGKSSKMKIRKINYLKNVAIEDFKLSTTTLLSN